MPNPPKVSNFDYEQLDNEISSLLIEETGRIRELLSQTISNIVQIGLSLIEVKKHLGHGQYMDWLSAEFEMSTRTAENFVSVAVCFGDTDFSELDIAKSALYTLAAPSVPGEARQEALEMAKEEHVSRSMARELVNIHKNSIEGSSTIPKPPPIIEQPVNRRRLAEAEGKANRPAKLAPTQQQVKQGDIWGLGRYHRLFCGDTSALKFRKILPKEIALVIHFPESIKDWPRNIPNNTKSAIAIYTSLDDFHLETFRTTVESFILGTADSNESVVMIGLPDPSLFILLDKLECQCICAEPSPELCNDAIAAWTLATKRKAKRL